MAIQVLPAALLSTAVTAALHRFSGAAHRAKATNINIRLTAIWIILLLVGLSQLVALLWLFPQKRTVHLLTGLIHGPLYDRKIWLHEDLIYLRIAHLIFAIGLGLAVCKWPRKSTKTRKKILITLLSLWVVLIVRSHHSAISGHGAALLQNQFSAKITTPDFNLYHLLKDDDALNLRRQIEFHIRDLKEIIGPIAYPVVDIYAYPDAKTKKLWFGGGTTDITDVRSAGIHITVARADVFLPHATLRHELVHALTSKEAFHGLGFHPNMALTEGLAVAFAPDGDTFKTMSLDESALKLIDSGRIRNPVKLFNPWSFWAESGMRAYTVAGSFAKWIKNEFGSIALMAIYRGTPWVEATGKNAKTLTDEWIDFLRRSSKADNEQKLAEVHANTVFRSRGVLGDRCPHSIANQWGLKLSADELKRMARTSGDPRYFVMAMRTSAAEVVQSILTQKKPRDTAKQLALKILKHQSPQVSWPPQSEEELLLRILAIDLLDFANEYRSKQKTRRPKRPRPSLLDSDSTMAQNPTSIAELAHYHARQPLPDDIARQIIARLAIDDDSDRIVRTNWRLYLAGWAGIPQTPTVLEARWIETYLRLRNLLNHRPGARTFTSAEALRLLTIEPDPSIIKKAKSFTQEWYRDLAIWFEKSSDILPPYQAAKFAEIAWKSAANAATSSTAKEQLELNAKRINQANMP